MTLDPVPAARASGRRRMPRRSLRPRNRVRLRIPRCRIGDPPAEQHLRAGLGGERRCHASRAAQRGKRRIAVHAEHASGPGVAENGHRAVAVGVQHSRAAGSVEGDTGRRGGPCGLRRQGEGEA